MTDTPEERESRPASARGVFGARVGLADAFVEILSDEGVLRGLIGPREPGRLWSRHIMNSAVIGEAIDEGLRVTDIGTGAGFPGIPLAIARPDLDIILVEPLLRRTTFLDEVVDRLELANVTVLRGRAEEQTIISEAGGSDVVTSRAVAPLDRLARWSAPLIRVGGRLIALKGQTAGDEIVAHGAAAAKAGLSELSVREAGVGVIDPPSILVLGTRVETLADRKAAARLKRREHRRSR